MKVNPKIGDVIEIPLRDGYLIYARYLGTDYAFYDSRSLVRMDLDCILKSSILFIVGVNDKYLENGSWKIIGNVSLEENLRKPRAYFMQDIIDPAKLSIFENGTRRKATWEECEGLERLAVWEPWHVISRIEDHYRGLPNIWQQQLKLRPIKKKDLN